MIRIGTVNLKKRFVGASEVLISYLGAAVIFQSITRYVSNYNTRVISDGGTVESLTNVTTLAQNLRNSDLFERLTLGLFPSGVKASKLYSLFPENGDGDLTVVRNTTATRVNSSGLIESLAANVARLNYDSLGSNPFLLLEPQRTNFILNSETVVNQSITTTSEARTLTFYGTGTINLSGTFSGSLVGTGINNRVTLIFTPTSGTLTLTVSGTVTKGQLEIGFFATSYIPTVASAVTRNQDLVNKTGISNLIGQTEGVIFLEIKALFDANAYSLISLTNATLRDRLAVGYNNTAGKLYIEYKTNNTVRFSSSFNIVKTDNNKIAVRYKAGEQSLFLNGIKTSIGTTSALFSNLVDELSFSYGNINTFTFEGKVNGLQLYKTALTDAECVSLTTL
jgi:hypothetical protein